MTDPQIKPVTAWAVVDNGNSMSALHVFNDERMAWLRAQELDGWFPYSAPHRVVEVTITPKGEG